MVIAAGLSPAWQQVLVVDRFAPGAVNRCRRACWCASGKVLNVGLALHHLSGRRPDATLTLSTLGGAAHEPIERELAELGVPRRWIKTASPTRICTTILDDGAESATELVENAGPLTDAELAQFEQEFALAAKEATAVVLTGSLPHGVRPDFFQRLLRYANCPAVLDIRGPELLAALKQRPCLVKPNREELAHTLGKPIANDDDLRDAVAELERRGAQHVVITAGSSEAWLVSAGKLTKVAPPIVERVVNPIGCGDCLAAGLAWSLAEGADALTALHRGLALAAANIGTLLPSDFDGRREKNGCR